MDKCLFCDRDLDPGSEEHVFLSALGGRLATRKATCLVCNNAFANEETGKVDDALAKGFEEIRNGLKIWSGRNKAPPTLLRAGKLDGGLEFDLAPGFVPVARPGKIPREMVYGLEQELSASSQANAEQMLSILAKRGASVEVLSAIRVQEKAPTVHRQISFDGPKVWRCAAKSAVVGCVVLFGNGQARKLLSADLLKAIRYGEPAINRFAGWDFVNEWPKINSLTPHDKTPDAQSSGFEHDLIVADVGDKWIAYISLFGGWRLSLVLGRSSGLPTRGFAVNPRSAKPARFIVEATAPTFYSERREDSFQTEHAHVWAGISTEFDRALTQWNIEAREDYAEDLVRELQEAIAQAGEDEAQRTLAVRSFAQKLACIELGESWETDLETLFTDDKDL